MITMANIDDYEQTCKKRLICTRNKIIIKTLPKAQRTRGLSSYHTSSYTNLDQISISVSRLSIDIKISSKHQYLDKS